MKCYTNKTKLQKRVVLKSEDGEITYFLERGQVVISKASAVFVDDGVVVSDVQPKAKKRSTKNADSSETESDSE